MRWRPLLATLLVACSQERSVAPPATPVDPSLPPHASATPPIASASAGASASAVVATRDAGAPSPSREVVAPACTGVGLDLARAVAAPECTHRVAPALHDTPGRVKSELTAPAGPTAPGADAHLVLSLVNSGETEATLVFSFDLATNKPETPLVTTADAHGKSTTEPMGKFPGAAGDEPAARMQGELDAMGGTIGTFGLSGTPPVAVVVLPPHGRAHADISWKAMGWKWGPLVKTKDGSTAKFVPAPLPGGAYTVTVEPRGRTAGGALPRATATVTVGPSAPPPL